MSRQPEHAAEPIVRLEQASFHYGDVSEGTPDFMLREVDLALQPGEIVGLIGRNGSGKTTLARLCNGLLKPTSGRVVAGGQDTRQTSVAELAKTVGYVFQNPDHQLFAPTVTDDVAFGPRNLGLPADEVDRRVRQALAELDLEDIAHQHPLLLGYGARRLVALAGVLALGSPALILDEPTAGLDDHDRQRLFTAVHERQRRGAAVLLITHDFGLVARHTSRVVVLAGGRIAGEGSPRAVLTDAALLADAGLAPTPVTRLAHALAPFGIPANLLTVDELAAAYERRYRQLVKTIPGAGR